MRSFNRYGAALAALLLTATFGACSTAGDGRPDPTEVVSRYLDAIASGDAETAIQLDQHVVDDAPADTLVDRDTLRTNAALSGAVHIDDVRVDPDTSGDETERAVSVSYSLDGEEYDAVIGVAWDDDAGDWVLADSLAIPLFIQAQVTRIDAAVIGFSVPGASYPAPASQDDAPVQWLAYPGVYEVTADLDPALLADPDLGLTRSVAVATTSAQPQLIYAVTALP